MLRTELTTATIRFGVDDVLKFIQARTEPTDMRTKLDPNWCSTVPFPHTDKLPIA